MNVARSAGRLLTVSAMRNTETEPGRQRGNVGIVTMCKSMIWNIRRAKSDQIETEGTNQINHPASKKPYSVEVG